MHDKITIYNDTKKDLTALETLEAVHKVMKETHGDMHTGPYIVFEDIVVTVVYNEKSTSFRVARSVR